MIEFNTQGLDDLAEYFETFPQRAPEAARRAVNYAARKFGKDSAAKIASKLNFRTKLYNDTNPGKGRIAVRLASSATLTAVVSASSEPLLLAKFGVNLPKTGSVRGISPVVKVGASSRELHSAFYTRFKNGTVGLAVRLKKGESLRNRHSKKSYPLRRGDPNVQILYGPSLDQAFESQVKDALTPVEKTIRSEFFRQLEVLGGR